jgi:protein CpxP
MRKIFFLFVFLLGFTAIQAQTNQTKSMMTAEQKADETVTKLKTELSLTDDQVTKVKAITVDKINKVTAAHKKNGADKSRLQAANKLIQDEYETQLKGIVTEEQFNKYLASKGH